MVLSLTILIMMALIVYMKISNSYLIQRTGTIKATTTIKKELTKYPSLLSTFSKKSGDKFQITVGFNVPLVNPQGQKFSKAFFVYDAKDYDLVLSDAVFLVEAVGKGEIDMSYLGCNRAKFEPLLSIRVSGVRPKTGSFIKVNGQWAIVQGDDFPVIIKIAPDNTLW